MNNKMKWGVLWLTIVSFAFTVVSCKSDDDDETSSNFNNFFYSSAKDTAPAIASEASSSSTELSSPTEGRQAALASGTMIYSIYTLFRDYQYPTDEGVVDMSNIYKVLFETGRIYETAKNNCTSITEQIIDAPFDLGLTETYNCAGYQNTMSDTYAYGYAIKESGSVKHALLTYRWAPDMPTHVEHGILQGSYDESNGVLSLHTIHNVYYASADGFVVRTDITGDTDDHSFTLRSIISGTVSSTNYTSIVGSGISQGAGNYFLFKVNSDSESNRYFCIEGTATEADLELMSDNGDVTADANCSSYVSTVESMTFLTDTTADIPDTIDDFTDSSIFLTYTP